MPYITVKVTDQELHAINSGYSVGITKEDVQIVPCTPSRNVRRFIIVSPTGVVHEAVTVEDELFKVKKLAHGLIPPGAPRVPDRRRCLNVWMNAETGSYRLWWNMIRSRVNSGHSTLQITEVPLVSDTPRPC